MKIIKKSRIINLIIIISICFGAIPAYSISDLGKLQKKRSYKKSIILSVVAAAAIGLMAALILNNKKTNEYSQYQSFIAKPIKIKTLQPKNNKNLIVFSAVAVGAIVITLLFLCYRQKNSNIGDNGKFNFTIPYEEEKIKQEEKIMLEQERYVKNALIENEWNLAQNKENIVLTETPKLTSGQRRSIKSSINN